MYVVCSVWFGFDCLVWSLAARAPVVGPGALKRQVDFLVLWQLLFVFGSPRAR